MNLTFGASPLDEDEEDDEEVPVFWSSWSHLVRYLHHLSRFFFWSERDLEKSITNRYTALDRDKKFCCCCLKRSDKDLRNKVKEDDRWRV